MITVRDCLKLPELAPAMLYGGTAGLDRPVKLAHVIDEPDLATWAASDVVVLTTWHNQPSDDDFWESLIRSLIEQQVSALFIAVGRYIRDIPVSVRDLADSSHFPVIALPWSLPFVTVAEAIHRRIVEDNLETWTRVSNLQIRVTEAAVRAPSLDKLLKTFSSLIGRSVYLSEPDQHHSVPGQRFSLGSPKLRRTELFVEHPLLSSPEQVIVRQMAGVLAVYLLQQQLAHHAEVEIQSAIVERLLQGEWHSDTVQRRQLTLMGFHPDRPHLLFNVGLPEKYLMGPGSSEHLDRARHCLTDLIDASDTLIGMTPQGLVLLLGLPSINVADFQRRLAPFFQEFRGATGLMSGPLLMREIPAAFGTMRRILPLLEPGTLSTMGEALFPTVIAELPKELMTAFVQSTWGRIRDPVLKETLRALVINGGARRAAANTLDVHRNTVANRVEQLEALLGRRLDAPFITQLDLAYQWSRTQDQSSQSQG